MINWRRGLLRSMKKHQIAAIIGGIILILFSLVPVILTIMIEGLIGIANPFVVKVFIYPILGIGISLIVITYALSKGDDLCINCMCTISKANLMRKIIKDSFSFLEELKDIMDSDLEKRYPFGKYERHRELSYLINNIQKELINDLYVNE